MPTSAIIAGIVFPLVTIALACFALIEHSGRKSAERREAAQRKLAQSMSTALTVYVANDFDLENRYGQHIALDKVMKDAAVAASVDGQSMGHLTSLAGTVAKRMERLCAAKASA